MRRPFSPTHHIAHVGDPPCRPYKDVYCRCCKGAARIALHLRFSPRLSPFHLPKRLGNCHETFTHLITYKEYNENA
jgi:hypothetical protein